METAGPKPPRAITTPTGLKRLLIAVLLLGLIGAQVVSPRAVWASAAAQPDPGVALVNAGEDFIDRRGDGGFVARPVFNPEPDFLGYGIKDPVDGSWLTAVYLVQGGPRRTSDGWEYTIEYPTLDSQPKLDPDRAYTLVLFASRQGQLRTFDQIIPVYQPSGFWDRILNAFNPATWARAVAGWVIEGVQDVISSVVQRVSAVMSGVVTGTPPALTYLHQAVQDAWKVVWVVVAAGLGVMLAWAGITFMFREHLGMAPFGWRELVPRLLIAVLAASTSLWWCSFIIDLADRITEFVAVSLGVSVADLLLAPASVILGAIKAGNVGFAMALAALYLIYGFFVLYLIGQFIIRLAYIDLLLVLGPAALGLWVLPGTASWGRYWLRTFLVTVFQQAVQLVALSLAFAFLAEYAGFSAGQPINDYLWQLLLSIAFVYLTTRIPSLMGNTGVFDSWMRTLHYGASFFAHLPAALRVAGLIAGAGVMRSSGGASGVGAGGGGGFSAGATAFGIGSSGLTALRGGMQLALPPPSTPPALPPRSLSE